MLLEFYNDKDIADRIWNEIEFCKTMRELRKFSTENMFVPKKEI